MSEDQDKTEAFLDSLPEIEPGQPFQFRCHPGVACFNRCCSDLNMMLTPYDVLRLRRALHMDSETFIKKHGSVGQFPDTGFPSMHLKMLDDPNRSCPFVADSGCTVYPDRSGACRTYPVGRASRLNEDGEIEEQFFLVQEPHCLGFSEDAEWNTASWMDDQGLMEYNAWNDRYMRLIARQKGQGPIHPKQATMVLLALYQVDTFQKFIKDTHMFARLEVSEADQEAILADEERALDFALNWVELVLYGGSDNLVMKQK